MLCIKIGLETEAAFMFMTRIMLCCIFGNVIYMFAVLFRHFRQKKLDSSVYVSRTCGSNDLELRTMSVFSPALWHQKAHATQISVNAEVFLSSVCHLTGAVT